MNIKQVLATLEKLARVRFAYSSENIDTTSVTLHVTNQPLHEVLQAVLSTQNMSFEVVGRFIVLNKRAARQPPPRADTVTDRSGKVLPDVTVMVVIGYGTQKRKLLTGAVSSVSLSEIQQTPSASLQNTLTGKLAGFFTQQRSGRPGADGADFFIRGVSTFNDDGASQRPLILVDDVEFSYTDFSNIDENEVESISVLKDAATTAPYGVKGANGVVLVTTRRGKVGKADINFRSESGVQIPMHLPKFLDAASTATLRNEAARNDALISGAPYVPEFTDADIELFRNGKDPYGHPNINWYNTLFKRSAPIQKYNFDVSGGTEKFRYFVNLGYENQGGILRNIRSNDAVNNNYYFDRINFRSNLDLRVTRSLSFTLDFAGNNAVTNSPKFPGASGSAETAAFFEVYNYESLNPYVYPIYNPNGSYGFTSPNRVQPDANNIIGRIALSGYQRALENLLTLNVSATQKLDILTPGLQAKLLVNVINGESSTSTLTRNNFPSYYYDPDTKVYTPRDATISRIDPYTSGYVPGRPTRQTTLQANLNYTRSFHEHNVGMLLLYNQSSRLFPVVVNTVEQASSYIPETLLGFTNRVTYNYAGRYLAEFDGSYNGSSKFAANRRYGFFPAGSVGWNIADETFVREHLAFLNTFKLRASYGIVGSDNLGNYANYYQETYIRGLPYSFGQSNTPTIPITPGTLGNYNVSWEKERKFDMGIDFSLFGNKLRGSADLFRDKRYDILTTLKTVPSYYGVGSAILPPENLGVVANNGYELELTYSGRFKKFRYSLELSYSYARNKILEIDEAPQPYPWQKQTGRSIGEVPEYKWDGFYTTAEAADPKVPKYAGSATAAGGPGTTVPGFLKYRDINHDGMISDADKGYFGKPNLPSSIVSLSSGLGYGRFSLHVLFQAALGNDVQVGYAFTTPFKGNLQHIDWLRWTPATAATAQFPSLITNFQGSYMSSGNASSFWAVSGNYLRLRSLSLSYQMAGKWIRKIGLKGLQAYANAYNLHTWAATYNKFGLDPEVPRGGATNDYQGVYPQSAIVNIGLSASIK